MTTSSEHTSVLGTKVQNPAGRKIGKVEAIVLDKETNHIMFAVLSFGGFVGVGEKYYPVPWSALDYDENHGAYTAPMWLTTPRSSSRVLRLLIQDEGLSFRDRTYAYYKAERYWE